MNLFSVQFARVCVCVSVFLCFCFQIATNVKMAVTVVTSSVLTILEGIPVLVDQDLSLMTGATV